MTISLAEVSLRYGEKQVLDCFSLTLPAHGMVCIFGPSGCGKTSLLRLISGLTAPDVGELCGLEGVKPAVVFQENRLLPWLTVLENVLLVLPDGDAAEARRLLELVELGAEAEKLPGELSGGMQRRVALARALAFGGDLLLLDEPFTGLDNALAKRMMSLIAELYEGKLVLMITHDKDLCALADHVYPVDGLPLTVLEA